MQVMCTLYANDEEVKENVVSADVRIPENIINVSLITTVQYAGLILLTF